LEEQLLEQWTAEDLFHETQRRAAGADSFVFYEGPPTANGRPGIHHVFSRTIKDLICRFHAMRGKQVTRIAGWDTHGLPVEIEVEKQLNPLRFGWTTSTHTSPAATSTSRPSGGCLPDSIPVDC
jgi:isoleucyl-tRNA synthetase